MSRPGFGYAGLSEPTTALIKPQMRNYYCRFFFKVGSFYTVTAVDGYPYFQNPRRNHYVPEWFYFNFNGALPQTPPLQRE